MNNRLPMIPLLDEVSYAPSNGARARRPGLPIRRPSDKKFRIALQPRKQIARPKQKQSSHSSGGAGDAAEGPPLPPFPGANFLPLAEFTFSTPVGRRGRGALDVSDAPFFPAFRALVAPDALAVCGDNHRAPIASDASSFPSFPDLTAPNASDNESNGATPYVMLKPKFRLRSRSVTPLDDASILDGVDETSEFVLPGAFFPTPSTPCD